MVSPKDISLTPIGFLREGDATVYVDEVDGEKVRDLLDVNFVAGGNPARYPYVQCLHIWIEAVQTPKDKAASIVHEFAEYALMKVRGWTYERAHDQAARWEARFRKVVAEVGPERLDPLRMAARFLVAAGVVD